MLVRSCSMSVPSPGMQSTCRVLTLVSLCCRRRRGLAAGSSASRQPPDRHPMAAKIPGMERTTTRFASFLSLSCKVCMPWIGGSHRVAAHSVLKNSLRN
jgi:hypothetical protein